MASVGLGNSDAPIRVLMVDDNALFLTTLATQLARTPGIDVVARAYDGIDALRLAEALEPDVVIVDISMPGLNGLEVAQRLKHRGPRPRVVVLSLYDEPEYREQAVRAGVDAYLVKGAVHADLVPLLCALCE